MLIQSWQESDHGVFSFKSPSVKDSGFLPVFRSGSCAEKGVKQYMEDEHICIDDLVEELGAGAPSIFPPAGAFYGVSNLLLLLLFLTVVSMLNIVHFASC